MATSVSAAGSGEIKPNTAAPPSPSKWKKCGFVIAIILGMGGLATGGAGLAGYFHQGALSHLSQADAIAMMTAGGGGGTLLSIFGIIGLKNQKASHSSNSHPANRNTTHQTTNHPDAHLPKGPSMRQTEFIEKTNIGMIRDGRRFGKAEWETHFGAVGDEPALPVNIDAILNTPCPFSGDESIKVKDTHMLVLIPATVNGEALTPNKLQELIRNPQNGGHGTDYAFYSSSVKKEHGETPVSRSYWILMTRDIVPETRNKVYNEQHTIITQRANQEYTVPNLLEASIGILMEHAASGNKLFGERPRTYTRCSEVLCGQYPFVAVGGFGSSGLRVASYSIGHDCGMAALKRF